MSPAPRVHPYPNSREGLRDELELQQARLEVLEAAAWRVVNASPADRNAMISELRATLEYLEEEDPRQDPGRLSR